MDLAQVLRDIISQDDPNLIVGFDLSDDAGVYRLTDDIALVQTVDIFTPVVDDPYSYGQIAAANALSDIYAMGGKPLTALNIAAFPRKSLPFTVLADILRGGLSKAREAGVTVVGGHTVENAEPLYGMAVTGVVHPARVATNAGARAGDVLVLTKALGTGIVSTAIKKEACPDATMRGAMASMTALNRDACEAMVALGIPRAVHACTDVSGFGLLGHAAEMARASGVSIEFDAAVVPLLPGVAALAQDDRFHTGGAARNEEYVAGLVELAPGLAPHLRHCLYDPQTSGGLLIAVSPDYCDHLLAGLQERGVIGAALGRVTVGPAGITVLG